MEQHRITFFDLQALAFGLFIDLFAVECGTLLDHGCAVVGRHVQHDAARHEWGDFFDAQLFQSVGLNKIRNCMAVSSG